MWSVWATVPGSGIPITEIIDHILPATLFPNPDDPDGYNPFDQSYNDYLTYLTPAIAGELAYMEPCLSSEAMSYLTQSAWDLMHIVKATYASDPNLDNVGCSVSGDQSSIPADDGTTPLYWYCQNVDFVFGNWHYIANNSSTE